MAGRHNIDYRTVFSEVEVLRGDILGEVGDAERVYTEALASIDNLDGAAHAALLEAVERDKQKALVTAEVLTKLLDFINNAAEYYLEVDRNNAALFPTPARSNQISMR